MTYKDLVRSVEYFGISLVQGLFYFKKGKLDSEGYLDFVTADTLGWKSLNQTQNFLNITTNYINNLTTSYPVFKNITYWLDLFNITS